MFLVRSVFHCKPGKVKEFVEKIKKAAQFLPEFGVINTRILTDVSATFWTVVIQSEVEDLNAYADMAEAASQKPKLGDAMKGYLDLVEGGFREIYRIE
jgi:hypothetical protein